MSERALSKVILLCQFEFWPLTMSSYKLILILLVAFSTTLTLAAYIHPAQHRHSKFHTRFLDILEPSHRILLTPGFKYVLLSKTIINYFFLCGAHFNLPIMQTLGYFFL